MHLTYGNLRAKELGKVSQCQIKKNERPMYTDNKEIYIYVNTMVLMPC